MSIGPSGKLSRKPAPVKRAPRQRARVEEDQVLSGEDDEGTSSIEHTPPPPPPPPPESFIDHKDRPPGNPSSAPGASTGLTKHAQEEGQASDLR